MPPYEFRCAHCGTFERHLDLRQSTDRVPCPDCAGPTTRVYTPPGLRTTGGPLASAAKADRARYERAVTGEPTVTGPPQGRRLDHRHRH